MAWRDLGAEALAGLFARPMRSVLTVLGTVLGIGALVATMGISRTAGNQIVGRFDELAATEVLVEPASLGNSTPKVLPWDAERRMRRLNGVTAAGTYSPVDVKGAMVSAAPVEDPTGRSEQAISVKAASPGLFAAARATVGIGRAFDAGHDARRERVAVLGAGAAARLHMATLEGQPAISIGGEPYTVIGIITATERLGELMDAIVIPDAVAAERWGLGAPASVHVDTVIGAARTIADQAPLALAPNAPELVEATSAREPAAVRRGVSSDLQSMFLVLGAVSLLVGAIGIANVTLVSVIERIGEIGLRRALGAARRHIAAQFLAESGALGLLGGIAGSSAGILVVVAVSASRGWTPVLDPKVPLIAPALGTVVGLAAGLYPALRAAALQPVDALRSGT